jgi:antitoxin (DNA-binding transcriptional repressor) of toxin-antitoxin stability system
MPADRTRAGLAHERRSSYGGPMEKATISELKNGLSSYLDKVRAGETVVILDRDRPIARIERIGAEAGTDERLARLERSGIVRRASKRLPADVLTEPAPASRRSVLQALLDERADAR